MSKASPIFTNYTKGELSPFMAGRVDVDQYFNGAETLENFLINAFGNARRRGGTKFVAEVADSSEKARLLPFQFSTEQTYVLELCANRIRFYRNNGAIVEAALNIAGITQANPGVVTITSHGLSNGDEIYLKGITTGPTELNGKRYIVANKTTHTFELTDKDGVNVNTTSLTAWSAGGTVERIYEIDSPYDEEDLFEIQYAQSADVMYLVHKDYAPRKLSRTGHTSWSLDEVEFIDGPYIENIDEDHTMTPAAATGTGIQITSSTAFFTSEMVGHLFRINTGYGEIKTFTDSTHVSIDIVQDLGTTSATDDWGMGAWGDAYGWPRAVSFYEQRLCFAGSRQEPQTAWLSVSGEYENMDPGDGSEDTDALNYTIATEQVNAIRWISAGKILALGTSGGVFSLSSGSNSEPLTPTNVVVKRETTYGAKQIQPRKIGTFLYYITRDGKKLREFAYSFDVDAYTAKDMTLLSQHVTGAGVVDMDYQQNPNDVLWCVREDGVMPTFTRQIEQEVFGWCRQVLGGSYLSGAAVVETNAVIAKSDESYDEVWIVTKRTIDGSTRRYVEYFMPEDFDYQEDAFFVDSGLSLDNPISIQGMTQADPVVVTAVSHGLSDGDRIRITKVEGMTDVNHKAYTVANKTTHTFELTDSDGNDIDGTAFGAYTDGGEIRLMVDEISNLDHLEGEEVSILADGAVHPNKTVENGAVSLNYDAALVHVGLPYVSTLKTMKIEAGSSTGTAQAHRKKVFEIAVRLWQSLGMKAGDPTTQDTVYFRTSGMAMSQPPSLFTGDKGVIVPGGWSKSGQVVLKQDQPLPLNVLAIIFFMENSDR